jgi:ribonuclease P protein subunit RPR2
MLHELIRCGKAKLVVFVYGWVWSMLVGMDGESKRIALERVRTLFRLASENVGENPDLAQRYVFLARRVAMAAKVRLPREYRGLVCRRCKRFVFPGVNCHVRVRRGREPHLVVTCLECGGMMRMRLAKRKVIER